MKMSKLVVPVVAAVVLVGAAGGGWYVFGRTVDPMKKATTLMQQGDLRGAQIELRNAVRQNPDSPEAHMRLGQTQMQMGDPVAGEKELKTARDLGGDRWAILPILGEAYMAQGRYKDILSEIPAEGPTPAIAARNMMLRAMAQVALNDIDAAKATLAQAEKLAPGNVEVLLAGARLAVALKDYDVADQKADAALKLQPDMVDALLVKGQILTNRGDRAGAMAISDRLVAAQPNSAPARLDRANQAILMGNDKKAQEDVNAVLAAQPRNAGGTYMNAVLLVRAGKYVEASAEFQKLGNVIVRFPRAMYFQALIAANLGQLEQSIDFASHYVARSPSDPDGVRLLARTLLTAKQTDKAVDVLTKAVDGGQSDSQTLDLLGRAYALAGKGSASVKTLEKANALAPTDPNIMTHLASSQLQQGDAAAAQSTLEKSIELAPNQPNSGEALVAAGLSAGDIAGAEAALDRLRAQKGDTEQVGILTGMVKLGRLDLDGGRVAFTNTLKQFPDSITAKLNLAKVLVLQGRRPEGEGLLKEILAKDPANLPALGTLVQLLIADSQFQVAIQAVEAARQAAPTSLGYTAMLTDLIVRSGDPRRAVAMLQAMRDTEELPPILLAAMARAQAAAGLNDEALKTYRTLLTASPNDLETRRNQVDLMLKLKDVESARASLRDALKSSPGNIGIMSAMITLEAQTVGLDGALKLADQLRNDPANLPNSTILRGDALMLGKRYGDAEQAFLAEYKLAPTTPLVLRLANAASSAGHDDAATTYLQDWLKRTPEDVDPSQMLALLDIKAKRYPDAEKHLQTVLSKRPGDTVALNNLAWLYGSRNDPRGRSMAQRAYLQSPTPETADTLGWIMVKEGDAKSGLPLLQQATTQRPADMTVKYHLAVALNDNGRKDDALKVLQPLLTSGGDFDDKAKARKLLEDLTPKK